ncbi:MAG TPA: C25 family cysteine peptidase, partial [Blastocatellia bacterium]|nr:C25 family cysteine peptidase [Blastocatellia bacterium]
SDEWFAETDEDGLPAIAIGRLPARSVEEVATMVEKIVGYDRSTPSDETLIVADANDGFDFEAASTRLEDLVSGEIRPLTIYRGLVGDAQAREALFEAISRGQKIVNYTGHGNVNQWRANLLTNDDAGGLDNRDHLSLFVLMTCLNGYFNDPYLESLGEALMKARGGAVAVWASSGITLPNQQALMNQELYRQLFGSRSMRLGIAVSAAKAAVNDDDVRRSWILLGDPTMTLR